MNQDFGRPEELQRDPDEPRRPHRVWLFFWIVAVLVYAAVIGAGAAALFVWLAP